MQKELIVCLSAIIWGYGHHKVNVNSIIYIKLGNKMTHTQVLVLKLFL